MCVCRSVIDGHIKSLNTEFRVICFCRLLHFARRRATRMFSGNLITNCATGSILVDFYSRSNPLLFDLVDSRFSQMCACPLSCTNRVAVLRCFFLHGWLFSGIQMERLGSVNRKTINDSTVNEVLQCYYSLASRIIGTVVRV